MSNARSNIFKRLAAAGLDGVKIDSSEMQVALDTSSPSKALFIEKMQASHAEIVECNVDNLKQTLAGVIQQKQIQSCLISERTDWLESQDVCQTKFLYFPDKIEDFKQELFEDIEASVTTSRASIAETGSIILWPDAVEPRSMSLVPPIHMVIVEEQYLHHTFASVMQQQNWKADLPTNVLLVSGPSKTADIQQTLAYGAHGPRELIVLLVAKAE